MFTFLSNFLEKKQIDCFAPISLQDCKVVKPYLLEQAGITTGSVIMLAVPYLSKTNSRKSNISAYAIPRDYHLYFKELFDELLPQLKKRFPQFRFAGFADHSPICETEAAVKAGLGVLGKNRLLLTQKYSSYVFLGEIFTNAILPTELQPLTHCQSCGACQAACPKFSHDGVCLSELTQKKGSLSKEEEAYLLQYKVAWGCDICQAVCPYTKRALTTGSIFTPIPFFSERTLENVTSDTLECMDEDDFRARAYAWRGRETITRNLKLIETDQKTGGNEPC